MNRLHIFLQYQIKEIEVYKWIESEKAGKDLGSDAEIDWVCKYACDFRNKWESKYGKVKP